jgi:hypothetical protein
MAIKGKRSALAVAITTISSSCAMEAGLSHRGTADPTPMSAVQPIGQAEMSTDRTVTVYWYERDGRGSYQTKSVFSPESRGYRALLEHIGGLDPGQRKPIPPYAPTIGHATMSADGTITLHLVGDIKDNIVHSTRNVSPNDPMYKEVKQHIGGIKPGQTKPVPPWPK